MSKKVVIGMSGGVDSSVAAYLLSQQGYDCIGVTMKNWRDPYYDSSNFDSIVSDAKRICDILKIPHYVVDFGEEFKLKVVDNFANEYFAGHTPNPCIMCNPLIKWASLLSFADEIGADYIATGHYANIVQLENGRYSIKKAASDLKDQTYALYRLSQDQLKRTLMPCGQYEKSEIREFAKNLDLQISEKKDSMEICFIPDNDYSSFLKRNYTCDQAFCPGNFVDKSGKVLGEHRGYANYTIGQRKHLNLAMGHPVFVTHLCPEKNEVTIGENEDLFSTSLVAKNINLLSLPKIEGSLKASAKVRYSNKVFSCTVTQPDEDHLKVIFDEPVRAITKGQSVVIYDQDILIGGGIIE